jgi:hypothetical protein
MTDDDLTLPRERLLALRARLLGDITQMENNALNKDHSRTTSMPTNMAELGSDNSDQELTLSLLGCHPLCRQVRPLCVTEGRRTRCQRVVNGRLFMIEVEPHRRSPR